MKVLIAEDNEDSRILLMKQLRANGHEVMPTADGIEALEQALAQPPDIIVSDILMPKMDGYQLCQECKQNDKLRDIPFVFYTATYLAKEDEKLGLSLGANSFIRKPTEPDVLVQMLSEIVEKVKSGTLAPPKAPLEPSLFLTEYNKRIVAKLEEKMAQLETEITERKQAEEKIKQTAEEWSTTFDSITDLVSVHDKDFRLIRVNKAFADVVKIKPEELIGRPCYEIVHGTNEPVLNCPYKKTLETKKPATAEFFEPHLGMHLELSTSPIFDEKGEVVASVHLIRDITERKRAEEERKKLEAQLLQVQKMEAIGMLSGGVAHDFNNLLTPIIGYSQLILDGLGDDDPLRKDIEEIRKAGERAALLTRQLLAFSRKQALQPEVLNLNSVVSNMDKMLKRLIGEDIELVTVLEPELRRVKADSGQAEQVIMNFVVNSRDAMPEGGKLTIRTENVTLDEDYCKIVREARPGKFIRLSIEDTGVGMDKETLQHIFEPFFTTKEAEKGTGLGLSVVYGIIKQHEGWINVYSEPGQGTTFKVYLPALSVGLQEETEEKVSLSELKGRGERILLIEDEEGIREFAARALGENGYVVFKAATANEAVKIFDKEKGEFHLVFSDVVLPDKGGLQLVDQLLSRKPKIPVLMCSGYADQKSQWPIIRERGFQFLQKPYTLSDLLRAVREVVTQAK